MKLSAAIFFAAAAVLGFAASAGAVDGTIEINQAKVLAAGGFPYLIGTSGSYRLTGNLTVSSNGTDAIEVVTFMPPDAIKYDGTMMIEDNLEPGFGQSVKLTGTGKAPRK